MNPQSVANTLRDFQQDYTCIIATEYPISDIRQFVNVITDLLSALVIVAKQIHISIFFNRYMIFKPNCSIIF